MSTTEEGTGSSSQTCALLMFALAVVLFVAGAALVRMKESKNHPLSFRDKRAVCDHELVRYVSCAAERSCEVQRSYPLTRGT